MRTVITADLHLTNRPLDNYRWDLFKWLAGLRFHTLVILGDLVDEKDCHCSTFVNRVVDELVALCESGHDLHVLMGNHDYSIEQSPFFRFLQHYPGCHYHSTPGIHELGNMRWAFYPHSKDPGQYWGSMSRAHNLGVDIIACHQTFSGAVSEGGRPLDGCDLKELSGNRVKIFSGDVHVPQTVGQVEYVGAPYPINFGDAFDPHVVVVDGDHREWTYLEPPHINKLMMTIRSPEDIEFVSGWKTGDQVKIKLLLGRSNFGRWESYRKSIQQICMRNELILCGIEIKERTRARLDADAAVSVIPVTREDQFVQFCNHAKVDRKDANYGLALMED